MTETNNSNQTWQGWESKLGGGKPAGYLQAWSNKFSPNNNTYNLESEQGNHRSVPFISRKLKTHFHPPRPLHPPTPPHKKRRWVGDHSSVSMWVRYIDSNQWQSTWKVTAFNTNNNMARKSIATA